MNEARRASSFGYGPPETRRGFLPLVMGALAAGKAIYGAVSANQRKQRNKGYISEAYRTAKKRMHQEQAIGRQSNLERLAARGISPIQSAMGGGAPTTIGGRQQQELEQEYALDRHALDKQYERDINENQAAGVNAQIGSIAEGIQGVAGAYGAGQQMAALKSASAQTPIASAVLSGSAWDNIHPVDPLGDPSSAWYIPTRGTVVGASQPNAYFNTQAVG